jgi:hypothetical protein
MMAKSQFFIKESFSQKMGGRFSPKKTISGLMIPPQMHFII